MAARWPLSRIWKRYSPRSRLKRSAAGPEHAVASARACSRSRRAQGLGLLGPRHRVPGPHHEVQQRAHRRIGHGPPELDLALVERRVVLRAGEGRARSGRASATAGSPRPRRSARPARPATWVRSWNVRSAARKSGRPSPTSASMTPTRVTRGKSWPLAIICVPDQDVGLPRFERGAGPRPRRLGGRPGRDPPARSAPRAAPPAPPPPPARCRSR